MRDELRSKVDFLRLGGSASSSFPDVFLETLNGASIPAHRLILMDRSPVFKAMFENEMEENVSKKVKIIDASYNALLTFVNFLYTAEASFKEENMANMALDLMVLAEKYQVNHLKTYCEKFIMSNLKVENSISYYVFGHEQNSKKLTTAALSLIKRNMKHLTTTEEYKELKKRDPSLLLEIYEAYTIDKEQYEDSDY